MKEKYFFKTIINTKIDYEKNIYFYNPIRLILSHPFFSWFYCFH